jgi:hypothetical protein
MGEGAIVKPFRDRVLGLIECAFGGMHHVKSAKWYNDDTDYPSFSCLVFHGTLSTYDSDRLTSLVFAAHDYCVRVEVANGGPSYTKIEVFPRKRGNGIASRHPTLEEAIVSHRRHGWKEREEEDA